MILPKECLPNDGIIVNDSVYEHSVEVNDKKVPFDWHGKTGNHWKMGSRLVLSEDTLTWKAYTVERGSVVLYWKAGFVKTSDGSENWKWNGAGTANCFAFGFMPIDEGYLEEIMEEMMEEFTDDQYWKKV